MEDTKFTTDTSLCLTRELQSQNQLVQPSRKSPNEAFPVAAQRQVLALPESHGAKKGSKDPAGTGALEGGQHRWNEIGRGPCCPLLNILYFKMTNLISI